MENPSTTAFEKTTAPSFFKIVCELWLTGNFSKLANFDAEEVPCSDESPYIYLMIAIACIEQEDFSKADLCFSAALIHELNFNFAFEILFSNIYISLGKISSLCNLWGLANIYFDKNPHDFRKSTRQNTPAHLESITQTFHQISYLKKSDPNYPDSTSDPEKKLFEVLENTVTQQNFQVYLLQKENIRLQSISDKIIIHSDSRPPIQRKVFCLGSNKTGTTSLDSAMRILGFRSMPEALANKYVEVGASEALQEINFHKLLANESFQYNFFQDLPFCFGESYKIACEFYPNAKFILLLRDPNDWFESCLRWIKKLRNEAIYQWIWGCEFSSQNRLILIHKFEQRNQSIIEFFEKSKNENLFISDIAAINFHNLTKFLNLPDGAVTRVKHIQFPKDNENSNPL